MATQTFRCSQCGETFDNRRDLGKHCFYEHQVEKKIIIPPGRVKELDVMQGTYGQVICEGPITEEGMVVESIRYV